MSPCAASRRLAAAAALALGWALPAAAQTPAPVTVAATPTKTVQIARVQSPPRMEDYLDSGSRPGTAVTTFLQRDPKDLAPATEATTAYISFDDTHLYVAFVCTASNPSQVRARMTKREDLFRDDFVAVLLDTFHDQQRAYMFFVNPLGIQADGVNSSGGGDDMNFDTQWDSAGRLTPTGYVAWMAIPFKSLRFRPPSGGSMPWGVAFMRAVPVRDEQDFWPGISNKINGFVSQFGVLEGLEGMSPGRNLQFVPYATFARARLLDVGGTEYRIANEGRTGVDAKVVVKDAMTLDFTLNPDFSQVESDDPQVTVNQRFEVFFPEKRPFFLENADYFNDLPGGFFFSRRLADPRFGARATGKMGRWGIGALVADDRAPGQQEDPGSPVHGDEALAGVFRVKREFARESRAGGMLTTRSFGPSSNSVAAADTHLRFGSRWSIDASIARSANTTLDGVSSTGTATNVILSRSGRRLGYNLFYFDASPDFHTDLGFVPRLDFRQLVQFFNVRWYPKTGPLNSWGPNSLTEVIWNYDGQLRDWTIRLPIDLSFKRQSSLFYRHAFLRETIGGTVFYEREDLVEFGSDYFPWLGVRGSIGTGTRPNYYPSARLVPFLANYTDMNLGITVRPASAVRFEETLIRSRLDARPDSPGSGRIFSNPIFRSRLNWQLSREWSVRAIVDYNTVEANPDLVDLNDTRHFGADLLLTWLLHPGTAFYLGYFDGYDAMRLDARDEIGRIDPALHSTGRQVFAKMSWLLRF